MQLAPPLLQRPSACHHNQPQFLHCKTASLKSTYTTTANMTSGCQQEAVSGLHCIAIAQLVHLILEERLKTHLERTYSCRLACSEDKQSTPACLNAERCRFLAQERLPPGHAPPSRLQRDGSAAHRAVPARLREAAPQGLQLCGCAREVCLSPARAEMLTVMADAYQLGIRASQA